jgi:predicted NBD/HSP70 family sugar kinase
MRSVANQWLREVLLTLYRRSTATRAEIMAETGLHASSVSQAMRPLLRNGTILKVGDLESNGAGRPREVFNLNPDAAYFVSVDLEAQRIRFALLNFVGDIRYRWEEATGWEERLEVNKVFHGISMVLRSLDSRQLSRVLAVGISYPGMLDDQGRLTAFNLGLHDFPLLSELREKASTHRMDHLPVFIEPDRHSAVVAERWLGRARGYQNGLLLFVERGIGIGLFLDGKPVEGWRNMAGEIGHWKIEPGAEDPCGCGKRGCLEAIASSPSMIRQYLESTGQPSSNLSAFRITDVFEKARQGDPAASRIVERAGKAIGLALSHAINLLNPQIVILGGDLTSADDLFLPPIEREISQNGVPQLTRGIEIAVSALGLDMRLKGAGALAFRKSLVDPALLRKMCSPVSLARGSVLPAT